jgi:hypothetical protein
MVRRHAGFDPDEAWRHVHKPCGNSAPRDFFAQNDCTFLIQANHVQRVLTSIDTNRVDNRDVPLAGHGDALLVLFESPKLTL